MFNSFLSDDQYNSTVIEKLIVSLPNPLSTEPELDKCLAFEDEIQRCQIRLDSSQEEPVTKVKKKWVLAQAEPLDQILEEIRRLEVYKKGKCNRAVGHMVLDDTQQVNEKEPWSVTHEKRPYCEKMRMISRLW
ncbi:hypothetical protein RF11_13335 [Thelohanellus kitauei]|uniref:Uncharacterized protein n=1 Tax=Thelohanellus kitauei TaxID=669202 RepID=A0A0C2NK47_THEKT|nr:hypothetical protein RF11_13335 [Thelohanellus kitauei]